MKIKINEKIIFLTICLFPFVRLGGLEAKWPVLVYIYTLWLGVSAIVIIFRYIVKPCKIKSIVYLMVIFQGVLLFGTIKYSGSIYRWLTMAGPAIILALYFNYYLNINKLNYMIKSLYYVFEIVIYSNFLVMLIFPNGIYTQKDGAIYWILSGKNNMIMCYAAIAVAYAYKFFSKKSSRVNSLILICIISIIISFSGTVVTGLIAMFSAYFIFKSNNVKISTTYIILEVIYVFSVLFIVVWRLQEYFSYFIVEVLGKDLTLSYRTVIWDRAIEWIKIHPFLGWGKEYYESFYQKIGLTHTHWHNQLLDYFYQGGIVLISIVILSNFLLFIYLRRVEKKIRNILEYNLLKVLSCVIFATHICMIAEAYYTVNIYIPFFLLYCFCVYLKKMGMCKEKRKVGYLFDN